MPSSSSSSRPKPSEVATETKRHFLPAVRKEYPHQTHSYLFQQPIHQINLQQGYPLQTLSPPQFHICLGDPVDFTIEWEEQVSQRIPLICVANERKPGGDWDTGVSGFEERFCRRSSLSATLSRPGPESLVSTNYPIPCEGGIYSEFVVVFRGPHDQYKKLDRWKNLPVVSVTPTRWPKLNQMGTKYAFPLERDLVKNKMRAALRICAYYGHTSVVISEFGLGNTHRNPPQELAELWREVFLYDPDLRGRFDYVAFCFEDALQSTAKLILDDIARKCSPRDTKGKSKSHSSSSSSSSNLTNQTIPSDFEVFQHTFSPSELQSVMSRPDPRYGISMLTS